MPGGEPGVSVYKEIACNAGDIPLLGWEDPLEEGMETHSSILAGESHGWEEHGGLQSIGLQKDSKVE